MKRVLPAVHWPGGKSRHLKSILPLIPEHDRYVEPFGGGLAVFLAKPPSEHEVINDVNRDLVAFYRNARLHLSALSAELDFAFCSRADFEDYLAQPGLTEIQRAARWYMLNRLSWGGKGTHFAANKATPPTNLDSIQKLHERLKRVTIECIDYRRCITRYDRTSAFFFVDPPYLHSEPGAYEGWEPVQMSELADLLRKVKGSWMVTVDDSPENREIFGEWNLRKIQTTNALAAWRETAPMKELLIMRE